MTLEERFNEIVREFSERVYWHVRRFVNSHEDADDLVQDVFLKVWTALPSFRGEAQTYTWIYRIATNEALNWLRREKVRAALRFSSLDEEMERRIDADPWFNGDAAERNLSKAVARLPERQRQVFILRYYDEMPYEEMAKVLDTSVGSLKASYHIAQ
jgi:RNA polymerase sigma-70 factor (ECF subfamily)